MLSGAFAPSFRQSALLRVFLPGRHWTSLAFVGGLAALMIWQFQLGFKYNSNDTTNDWLRWARAASWALLPVLIWLPVMRNWVSWLQRSLAVRVLPVGGFRELHKWLGHGMFALGLIHSVTYLFYYETLDEPFFDVLFAAEPDLVRSMRTNMYEYVTEDEDIEMTLDWINAGMPREIYDSDIKRFLADDCTKCHNRSATRSYARNDMPMTTYEDVVGWTNRGIAARQFRINVSGLVMFIGLLAIWATSLAAVRRKAHHLFQVTHRLGYGVAVLALLHVPSLEWLVAPTVALVAELYLSRHRRLWRELPAKIFQPTADVLHLQIERPHGMRLHPGDFIQVRDPEMGLDEWHAFTLCESRDETDNLSIKIVRAGGWTRRLIVKSRQGKLRLDVRGPYASPVAEAPQYKTWVLVGGGIGITPFLNLLRWQLSANAAPRHVHLIWAARNPRIFKILSPLLEQTRTVGNLTLTVHLYCTRTDKPLPDPIDDVPVMQGRPDLATLFAGMELPKGRVGCFTCGPEAMMQEVGRQGRKLGWAIRKESFG